MKHERSGVHLLLGVLLLFSASVGFLYGDKKGAMQSPQVRDTNAPLMHAYDQKNRLKEQKF